MDDDYLWTDEGIEAVSEENNPINKEPHWLITLSQNAGMILAGLLIVIAMGMIGSIMWWTYTFAAWWVIGKILSVF